MRRAAWIAGILVIVGLAIWILRQRSRPPARPAKPRSMEQVLTALGPGADAQLRVRLARAGMAYPPRRIVLAAFKQEKQLEVHASDKGGMLRLVASYPILAASGKAGPKLREGDLQVPEGFYRIDLLNPNSRFHLSLRVSFPNAEDIARARDDRRDPGNLGSDIMIHGGAASIGCLAIGDAAVEELFILAARTGLDHVELIIAPCDLRRNSTADLPAGSPDWTPQLHTRLRQALMDLEPGSRKTGGSDVSR